MISAIVNNLQVLVPVVFRLPNQPDFTVEFVVDTRFEGTLTLPPSAVAALNLPYILDINAKLADDSKTKVDVHTAVILWDDREIEVAVMAMGRRPLLGTALLQGKHLEADFAENGLASIVDL